MRIRTVAIALAALTLAGCGAGQTPGNAGTGTQADKEIEFVNCLNDHGIPAELTGDGSIIVHKKGDPPLDKDKLAAAEEACDKFHPLGPAPEVGSEDWDLMVKRAQCLRQQGIDVQDPQPGDRGVRVDESNVDEQTAEQAEAACRKYEPTP